MLATAVNVETKTKEALIHVGIPTDQHAYRRKKVERMSHKLQNETPKELTVRYLECKSPVRMVQYKLPISAISTITRTTPATVNGNRKDGGQVLK